MVNLSVLSGWVFIAFIFFACSPGQQPAKTNVLGKAPTGDQRGTDNRRMSAGSMRDYHKNRPEAKPAPKHEPSKPVVTAPPKKEPNPVPVISRQEDAKTPPVTTVVTPPAARTPQYYQYLTDSIQRVSAKDTYYRMADSLMRVMTQLPTNSKNPAVNANEWYSTVNFNIRKPNFVVLHHTAQNSAEQTLFTFSVPWSSVSAHYVVGRDGVIHQMLNDYMRAWHAGNGKWGNVTDMNSCSLGIEIDNNGEEPFSDQQINALISLLAYLKKEYGIPQANFIAHSDIAPTRKNDPSKYFPWKKLADAGFGYWYNPVNMQEPPSDFNALLALRVIGFDISNQSKAIEKFKLHYIQNDTTPQFTDWDKKVLFNLYRQF